MVLTPSTMSDLGQVAPDFTLLGTDGQNITRDHARGPKGLLVAFICNHCPYVKHIAHDFAVIAQELMAQGIGVIGINSNDTEKYPADNMAQMQNEVKLRGYTFPYVLDETQDIAKKYKAACTPDFFLYDQELKLFYRGQLDESRPNQGSQNAQKVTGRDLKEAVIKLLAGEQPPQEQTPSIGCNIKWKPGHEPSYFR